MLIFLVGTALMMFLLASLLPAQPARAMPAEASCRSQSAAIAAGALHALTLQEDGTVCAFGNNYNGELGDETDRPYRHSLEPVRGLPPIKRIAAAGFQSFGITESGEVWVWGRIESRDGLPDEWRLRQPVRIEGLSDVAEIAGGAKNALFLKKDGTVWSWNPDAIQDRTKPLTDRLRPEPVPGLKDIAAISAGNMSFAALDRDGAAWTWGDNTGGQLGDGSRLGRSVPMRLETLAGIAGIAVGYNHMLAWQPDGTLWTWGADESGVPERARPLPVRTGRMEGVRAAAAGVGYSLLLREDGTVWGWGANRGGQLGDGTRKNRDPFVQASGIRSATGIAAGVHSSYAVDQTGAVRVWGTFGVYDVNNKEEDIRSSPVPVDRLFRPFWPFAAAGAAAALVLLGFVRRRSGRMAAGAIGLLLLAGLGGWWIYAGSGFGSGASGGGNGAFLPAPERAETAEEIDPSLDGQTLLRQANGLLMQAEELWNGESGGERRLAAIEAYALHALQAAEPIPTAEQRDSVYQQAARLLAAIGRTDEALQTVQRIETPVSRAWTRIDIAIALGREGREAEARQLLAEAEALLTDVESEGTRILLGAEWIRGLLEAKETTRAIAGIRDMLKLDLVVRTEHLGPVLLLLGKAAMAEYGKGKPAQAEELMRELKSYFELYLKKYGAVNPDTWLAGSTLAPGGLAGMLAEAGRFDQAFAVSEWVESDFVRVKLLADIAKLARSQGRPDDADKASAQALQTAERIPDAGSRKKAIDFLQ